MAAVIALPAEQGSPLPRPGAPKIPRRNNPLGLVPSPIISPQLLSPPALSQSKERQLEDKEAPPLQQSHYKHEAQKNKLLRDRGTQPATGFLLNFQITEPLTWKKSPGTQQSTPLPPLIKLSQKKTHLLPLSKNPHHIPRPGMANRYPLGQLLLRVWEVLCGRGSKALSTEQERARWSISNVCHGLSGGNISTHSLCLLLPPAWVSTVRAQKAAPSLM